MAYTFRPDVEEILTLARFVELSDDYDMSVPEDLLKIAPLFAALNANPALLQNDLRELLRDPERSNAHSDYTGQTFMLFSGPRYYIRANIWLPRRYEALRESANSEQFYYDKPHDHNFTFLTACHCGSGYKTRIYEYDGVEVDYAVGDPVSATFLEDTSLPEGVLMMYRASRDIHIQYPPDDFSITVNLMTRNAREQVRSQNMFDQQMTRVVEQPRGVEVALEQLCDVAAALAG